MPYKKIQHFAQIGGTAFLPYKIIQNSIQIGGTAFLPYKKSSAFRTNRRYGIPAVQTKALHSCHTKKLSIPAAQKKFGRNAEPPTEQ